MEISKVAALIAALEGSSLGSLIYEDSSFKLSLCRKGECILWHASGMPQEAAPPKAEAAASAAPAEQAPTVTAPLVGSVYRAREPGGQPLVSAGDKVAEGDPLCLIEAMKMFSEITAPHSGVIGKILFEDGQLVEYGAPLMTIEADA